MHDYGEVNMGRTKRNLGPERSGGAVKRGMFKNAKAIESAGFKSQVPTVPVTTVTPPARRPGNTDQILNAALTVGRGSAERGHPQSARPHAALGPSMTTAQSKTHAGMGGNVQPNAARSGVVIGNSRSLKRAGLKATRTDSYTKKKRR